MDSGRGFALPATLLLGAATIAFGFWGYLEGVPELGSSDALYAAIQLLGLDYDGPAEPPWQLEAGRYLGVLTLALAVVAILAAFARDRADRIRTRLLARNHHLIVGLGRRGLTVAHALRSDGLRVVAIDDQPATSSAAALRGEGVPVIVGDVRHPRTHRRAAAQRAQHVLICVGDDSLNLDALDACLRALPGRGPTLHVMIDAHPLWLELHRSSLTWAGEGGAIEFISIPDRVAARLVEEAGTDLASGRIIVWGIGAAAVRTAVHAVRWVLLNQERPRLILAGPHVELLEAELERTEPWIAGEADIEAVHDLADVERGVAFVVGLPHSEALAGAATLAARLNRVTVVAEVPTATSITALRRSGFPIGRVALVDAETQVLGTTLFAGSARELIARARHADYVEQERRNGVTPEENPSMRPWEELPDSLRVSNRRFADSLGQRLADLGAQLAPLRGARQTEVTNPALIEELARIEHDRWMADLVADGWRHHDGQKDPERKRHPLLVDWSELDESAREKDRDSIRGIPTFLARAGYELRIDGA